MKFLDAMSENCLKVRFSLNGRTRISYNCISFYPDRGRILELQIIYEAR